MIYFPWSQSGGVEVLIDGQEFASVERDDRLRVRVRMWERGIGYYRVPSNRLFDVIISFENAKFLDISGVLTYNQPSWGLRTVY